LEEIFFDFFAKEKEKKRKKQQGTVRTESAEVMGSAETSARSQKRRIVTQKDMISAHNGSCMQSHVDVVHNRLNLDDLQGDSLLRPTM
jgi:hypothetical protein